MNSRYPTLTLTLAVAMALASPCVMAMGLGQLQVKSGLNQPLVAEIPIISATPSELDQLDVRLASPEAFARIGLDQPAELTANLQFSVGKNSRGQPVIRVTTPDRFSEPLLSFLIEADWGKGKVTREYTALIDPPYIAAAVIQPMLAPAVAAAPAQAPAPTPVAPVVAAPPEPAPAPVASAPAAEPEPAAAAPEPEPQPLVQEAPAPVREAPPTPAARPRPTPPPAPIPVPAPTPAPTMAAAPGQYGPVSPGQTLWSIANSVRPDASVSVNQMMVALLRANPEAFAQDNINRLKRGSVLRVPGQEEVSRLSAAAAAALVNEQASAWRTPRQPVPQPAEAASANENIVPAAPTAPKVASAKPARAGSRLEIVPPSGNAAARGAQSGAAAGAGGSELRAELVQAHEDLAARTVEVTELKSRVADLEKQEADRQRLIEMQNSQMKELQDRLAQIQAAAPASPAQPADAAKPAQDAVAAAATSPVVEGTPWYLNPFVLGGAVLVALGGLVLVMRRSKPKSDSNEPAPRRLSDDDALRASMAKTRQAGEKIKQEPVLAVPVVPTKPAQPKDPELDALKAAVRSRPQDLEAHLSLLRLHHSRGNAVDYEVAAQAMRLQVPSTMDPRWREAVIMGASLMPGHTLFSQAGWNSPRYNEADAAARSASAKAAEPSIAEPAPAPVRAPEPTAAPAPVKVFEAPPADFDFKAIDLHADAPVGGELDLDSHADVFGEVFGTPPTDIHRNEAEMMVDDQSSATRIELAKAYLDIGDLDGARSMLEEVLIEGGPAAKAEAGRILREIG